MCGLVVLSGEIFDGVVFIPPSFGLCYMLIEKEPRKTFENIAKFIRFMFVLDVHAYMSYILMRTVVFFFAHHFLMPRQTYYNKLGSENERSGFVKSQFRWEQRK